MPSRRSFLAGAAGLAPLLRLALAADEPIRRTIPSSGEALPALGIGTARRYEVEATPDKIAPLRAAMERFVGLGGTVIDTAPSYGNAEEILGTILREGGLREKVFLATKVDTRDREAARAQIERSLGRLGGKALDLVAVHNLIDTDDNLAVLRELKQAGRIRYLGVTVWRDNQLAALEPVIQKQALDFIQVNYALDNRTAAERILPLARDRGMGVMINVPFGRDRLLPAVKDKPLPDWAAEFDCRSWPQFLLKYVLGHEAVTCPVPGMARVAYVEDNLGAIRGRLPDAAMRRRMEAYVEGL